MRHNLIRTNSDAWCEAIIDYINRTYMPVADQFAEYAVRQLRNYGICVTSRTEASHAQIKRLLQNKNGASGSYTKL